MSTDTITKPQDISQEPHYTVPEIAKLWHLHRAIVQRLFSDEPGVIKIGSEETRYRRGRITLRIPESVMVRVHRKIRSAN